MTKMAAMPMYGINSKKSCFQNQWVDFDETWYDASEIQAHYILFKFCNFGFYMEKCDNTLEIIASCDLKFCLLCKLND